MEFGYPGANTHLESHGVSEESFWPSFTDIMMVIVMVFLLVTVAVILNNWTLIADLKNSIQAQQIASNLAENRLHENDSLGSKLSHLEKKIIALNEKYELKKASLVASQNQLEETQAELSQTQKQVVEKNTALTALQTQIKTLTDKLASEESSLSQVQQVLTETKQQLTEKEAILAENEKNQQALNEALTASKATIATLEKQQAITEKEVQTLKQADDVKSQAFANLQTERSKLEKTVNLLKTDYANSQDAIGKQIIQVRELKLKLEALAKVKAQQKESLKTATDSGKMTKDALAEAKIALKELEEEKQRIITSMTEKLVESEQAVTNLKVSVDHANEQIKVKDKEILALKDNSQLRDLQGKYDTLDAKYQKLLRPARSSKGKYIVSVTYKKRGDKRIIRLKENPNGSYKTVTKKELHKRLARLKAKHKTDLYMKVIIPETSGLSYNEAWTFTSNLQKKYDYYHQSDKSK